ncbi:MAG: hypothetical protein KKA48_00960 [Proteobacteria bacterium]|nr:hypothetical protein [Pseudomonadota bacterium]
MVRRFLTVLVFLGLMIPLFSVADPLRAETPELGGAGGFPVWSVGDLKPVLTVNPWEVDLGAIGPGEEAERIFYLKKVGSGSLNWSMEGPEGWNRSEYKNWSMEGPEGWNRSEYKRLAGVLEEAPEPVKIQLLFAKESGQEKSQGCPLILRLEAGGASATFLREAPVGGLRESIRFVSTGGTRTVFFRVILAKLASAPLMELSPLRIDSGTVRAGEQITRMIHLTNRGREILKWKAGLAGKKGMPATAPPLMGRYVSFLNEAVAGTGSYSPVGALRENLEFSGAWAERGGYPSGQGEQNALRYRFTGVGVSLFIWKSPEGGPLSIYIDEQFAAYINSFSDRWEKVEIPLTEGLPDGPHMLSLVNEEDRTILEGVRIFGKPVLKGPPGWISVFPDSGTTLRETDYINIAINTRNLEPGIYGERVLFLSNAGEADVEVSLEVAAETQSRFLDVYRYVVGNDYLYTTNPRAEATRLQTMGYRNLGIAFRLFSPGTPGTTSFFRWFNPVKGDHFYSSDAAGGGKPLSGYLLEGSIGNIATSRLTGTRELYRWYKPATGSHFYTTDQGGEGLGKKGYRFEGIAGFVR